MVGPSSGKRNFLSTAKQPIVVSLRGYTWVVTVTHQTSQELSERPPYGKYGKEVLVASRNELYIHLISILTYHEPFMHRPRKIDESTGKLPPTPTDQRAAKVVSAMKFGDAPATIENTPTMSKVILNDILQAGNQSQCSHEAGARPGLTCDPICQIRHPKMPLQPASLYFVPTLAAGLEIGTL